MSRQSIQLLTLITVLAVGFLTTVFSQTMKTNDGFYNVVDYGAIGDGKAMDTQAIQKAIDVCHQNGGGTVFFPSGVYLTGSIHLKSNITLYLDNGSTILASPDDADFDPYEELGFENDADRETSYFHFSHIWGEDVENIAILGLGTIDGNRKKRGGPKSIALKRCKFVTIKDVTILYAPNYAISMLGTDYVNIDGVSILKGFCDGIDPDGCHHVRISNCRIETWDDAIVPKASFSLGYRRSVEYLTVTNCQLATNCSAFKLGTESGGDFKYITVSNCVIKPNKNYDPKRDRPATSGISLLTVDGSHIDGVTITNISMKDVQYPIFLRLGNRGRDMDVPVPGTLKNVIISNITATNAKHAGLLTGIPAHPIENVLLENIIVTCKGGGTKEQAGIDVPELVDGYPDALRFGELPAYGIYSRHVVGLTLENIQVSFESPDLRHAMVCDDVSNLTIESLRVQSAKGAASQILFTDVRDANVLGCRPNSDTDIFLRVKGENSKGIGLLNNDFSKVEKVFLLDKSVKKNSVRSQFNF